MAIVGPSTLAGQAYDAAARIKFPLDQIWDSLAWNTAVLAIATGFVAVPVGGAWALRQVVRPADVRAGAFAVLALGVFVLYVWIAGASGAEEQERYPAFLAAFPLIALGAALYRRGEVWVLGTVVLALLCARAIATRAVEEVAEPLSYFFGPAQLFFSKVIVGRLTTLLPGDEHMVTVATLLFAALAIAIACLAPKSADTCLAPKCSRAWHRRRRRSSCSGSSRASTRCASTSRRRRRGRSPRSPGSTAPAAGTTPCSGTTSGRSTPPTATSSRAGRSTTTPRRAVASGGPTRSSSCATRRGGSTATPSPASSAASTATGPVVFAAKQIARPTAYGYPMRVERFVGDEPRVAAVVAGAGEDGAVEDKRAEIVAFPALDGRCLDVLVTSRAEAPGPIRFTDRRGQRAPAARRGAVRPRRGTAGRRVAARATRRSSSARSATSAATTRRRSS